MPIPLVLFHKNCLDGRGAAAVVARKLGACDFIPMQYGSPKPEVTGRVVYMVDFGMSADDMRAIRAEAESFTWIDHHASQADVHKSLGWGILDTSECGTSLTWKTLFPDEPLPPVVTYIRDKDLWRWELPNSRHIAAGLEATFSDTNFAELLTADLECMAEIGKPLVEAQREAVLAAAKSGILITDAFATPGLRAFAVRTRKNQNELGELICLPVDAGGLGYDIAVLYYSKAKQRWVHSLRSTAGGTDCAVIAAKRGGGGHPTAASFIAKEPIIPRAVGQLEV
jgi:uncharacterized protein